MNYYLSQKELIMLMIISGCKTFVGFTQDDIHMEETDMEYLLFDMQRDGVLVSDGERFSVSEPYQWIAEGMMSDRVVFVTYGDTTIPDRCIYAASAGWIMLTAPRAGSERFRIERINKEELLEKLHADTSLPNDLQDAVPDLNRIDLETDLTETLRQQTADELLKREKVHILFEQKRKGAIGYDWRLIVLKRELDDVMVFISDQKVQAFSYSYSRLQQIIEERMEEKA